MTDRERIYNLVDKVCDLSIKAINKITELKQENSMMLSSISKGWRNLPKSTTSLGMRASLLMLRRKYKYARDII